MATTTITGFLKADFNGSRRHEKAAHVSKNDRRCRACNEPFGFDPFAGDETLCAPCNDAQPSVKRLSRPSCRHCHGLGMVTASYGGIEPHLQWSMEEFCDCLAGRKLEHEEAMRHTGAIVEGDFCLLEEKILDPNYPHYYGVPTNV